jgi:hypothetical protein
VGRPVAKPLGGGTLTAATVSGPIGVNQGSVTISEDCRIIVDLFRQLAAARGERDIYREMVSVALTQLHKKNIELKQERDSRFRLLAEFRARRGRRCR